jgi:acyl-CoA thioesterase
MQNDEHLDDELSIDEYQNNSNDVEIRTHQRINQNFCGEVIKIEVGYVEVRLTTTQDMVADDIGLIHGGFIFSAADYAAMLAVNEPNVVLVASDCQFLSPVRLFNEVTLIARVRHKEGRKRNVHVEGFVLDIKVFEGEFKTVITEKHVLKMNLMDEEEKQETSSS